MGIEFGEALAFAWERFKANPGFYLVGAVVIGAFMTLANVLSQIIGNALQLAAGVGASVAGGGEEVAFGSMILAIALSGGVSTLIGTIVAPAYVGFFKGVKREYEGGEAEIGELFSGFGDFIPAVLNYLVADIIVIIGFFCCFVPGILLSPILLLSMYYVAHGETQGLSALKKSFNTLSREPGLILWSFVLGLISFLGVLLCCVGLLFSVPYSLAALYAVFRQADGDPLPGTYDEGDSVVVEVQADQE